MRKMCSAIIAGLFFLAANHATAQDIGFEPLWRVEASDPFLTRPVVEGELVFVGGEDGILRAINRQNGEALWRYEAGAPIGSGTGLDEKRVFVISRDGMVHGVDKANGEGLWTFATEGEKQWDYWDHYLSTPVADDQHWLYFGSGDHHVYAINKRTGTLRWKFKTEAIVHGAPALSGERLIIGGYDGYMRAFDRATGKPMWAFKTVGNAYFRAGEIPGSATVADGRVYFGSRDYNLYALMEDTGTGAWNERTPSWVVGKPLVIEGTVYVAISDQATVFAYDATSGREKWATRLPLNVFAGAEALGSTLIAVPGLDGRIHLLDRESGEILAYHETRESAQNRSQLFDEEGKLSPGEIQSFEDLFGLYDRYLAELGGIAGGISVVGDVIYYATGAGTVAAIRVTGLPTEED